MSHAHGGNSKQTLQHIATHYNTLQHTATRSSRHTYVGAWHTHTYKYAHERVSYGICMPHITHMNESRTTYVCLRSHTSFAQYSRVYDIHSRLNHTTTHCNTLQHTATHCNTLQHTATHCNTLQHTETHCNTLQHTATHCNTLQHTATHTLFAQYSRVYGSF